MLAISSSAEAISFTSPSGPFGFYNIPDNDTTGVTASINISGQPNIASFDSVTISGFTHSYYGDLRAFLSNGATTVQLFRTSSSPDSQTFTREFSALSGNYTFATTGANWYTQTVDPVPTATTYASFAPLSAFNGSSLNGTWTLNVQDRAFIDTGSFSSFTIDATPVPFGFEPTGGLLIVGGAWFLRKQLKKKTTKV
ncbi:MAG: proprotein convertase P-domain-containing protein [Pseudanabaena sp. CAN_BIN31]|nr:proprotein convertase P-domain-containing protein [Pseudanabaena sp. CAN_BIN31]